MSPATPASYALWISRGPKASMSEIVDLPMWSESVRSRPSLTCRRPNGNESHLARRHLDAAVAFSTVAQCPVGKCDLPVRRLRKRLAQHAADMIPLIEMLGRLRVIHDSTPKSTALTMTDDEFSRFHYQGMRYAAEMHSAAHGVAAMLPSFGELNQWRERAHAMTSTLAVIDQEWYADFWENYYRTTSNLPRSARPIARALAAQPAASPANVMRRPEVNRLSHEGRRSVGETSQRVRKLIEDHPVSWLVIKSKMESLAEIGFQDPSIQEALALEADKIVGGASSNPVAQSWASQPSSRLRLRAGLLGGYGVGRVALGTDGTMKTYSKDEADSRAWAHRIADEVSRTSYQEVVCVLKERARTSRSD